MNSPQEHASLPPAASRGTGGPAALRLAALAPAGPVVPIEAGIARLPEDADISTPRANGADLEFVQPDGTVIVISDGAVTGFALMLGSIEIPPDAVAALLEANGIAAGPSGAPDGAHGGFLPLGPQTVGGSAYTRQALLDDAADLGAPAPALGAPPQQGPTPPVVLGADAAVLSEEGLDHANPDSSGNGDTTDAASFTGLLRVSDDGPLSFAFGVPSATLTSGGVALVWRSAGGTLTATAGAGGPTILVATITASGRYTVTLSGPLDHPPGQGENDLSFTLPVNVTGSDGLSATADIGITIEDDSPLAPNAATSIAEDDPAGAAGNVLADPGADGAVLSRVTLDGGESWIDIPAGGRTITVPGAGTYTFAPGGDWTFIPVADLSGAADFAFVLTDADGDEATGTQSIAVTPVNDAPVITPIIVAGSITEDKAFGTSGVVAVADIDSASLTTTASLVGAEGEVSADLLAALGNGAFGFQAFPGEVEWAFALHHRLIDYLGAGQTITVTYRLTTSDGSLSDTQDVTVLITGTNDAPVITPIDVAGTITEYQILSTSGSVTVADVDSDSLTTTASFAGAEGDVTDALFAALQGGAFTLQPGAADTVDWAFAIENGLIDYLGAGETITVTYRLTTTDGSLSDTQDVTVTITGASDALPPVPDTDAFSALEDAVEAAGSGRPVALGNVLDGDVDPAGLPLTVTGTSNWRFNETDNEVLVSSVGATGNRFRIWNQGDGVAIVEVAADGSVTLWAESGDPFRGLGIGETCSISFDYTVSNGEGGTATASASITITGTNDGPVARGYFSEMQEDTGTTGYATIVDIDDAGRSNLTVELISGPAHAKSFSIEADGRFTYVPADNYNGEDSFTYRVRDAQGLWSEPAVYGIRVTALEDAPQATTDNGNIDVTFRMGEDDAPKSFNQLANDRLDGDGATTVTVDTVHIDYNANHPEIDASDVRVTVDENNQLRVELIGDDWQSLNGGETAGIRVTYTLHGDKPGQTSTADLILQVAGSNDSPELDTTAELAMSVRSGAGAPIDGLTPGTLVSAFVDPAGGGGLDNVADPDGFVAGMAVTGLDASHGDWFYSIDGGAHWLSIDAASLSDANALLLRPEYRLYFQPDPGYADAIPGAISFRAWDTTGGTAGTYADVRSNGGTTPYSVATETIALGFVAGNDTPVLAAIAQPSAVAEIAGSAFQVIAPISGTLEVTDLDHGDTLTATVIGNATVEKDGTTVMIPVIQELDDIGALTFTTGVASNGATVPIGWIYNPGSANFDFLGAGETLTVTYTVRVSDGTGYSNTQTLTFAFTGTNDAPLVAQLAGDGVTFTEGGAPVAIDKDANAAVSDIDNTDFRGGSLTVAVTTNGVATEDVLSLATVEGLQIVGNSVRFFVDGAPREIATFTGGSNGTPLVLSLTQYATPVATAALVHALRYANTNLEDPSTAARTVTITLADGDGGTSTSAVTVAVTGVNDLPAILGATGMPVAENEMGALVGTFTVEDVDNPADLRFSVLGAGDVTDSRFEIVPASGTIAGHPGTYEVRLKPGQSLDYEAENADGNPSISLKVEVRDTYVANEAYRAPITVVVTDVYENVAPVLSTPKPVSIDFEPAGDMVDWTHLGDASVDVDQAGNHSALLTTGVDWNAQVLSAAQLELALGLQAGALDQAKGAASGDLASGSAQVTEIYLVAGQTLSFDWRFETNEAKGDDYFDDFAFVTINGTVHVLASVSRDGNSTGQYEFVASQPGVYTFGFGVINVGGDEIDYGSTLHVDNIVAAVPTAQPMQADANAGDPSGAVGVLVSELVDLNGGTGPNNVTDANPGSLVGLAVTGLQPGGTWWYSLDGGTTWTTIDAVTDAHALLLAADDRLYFQPAQGQSGTLDDALTFRAWDQTGNGVAGTYGDTTVNGDASPFSAEAGTADVEIATDAPDQFLLDSDPGLDFSSLSAPADDAPMTFVIDDLEASDLLADYDFVRGDRIDLSDLLDGVKPENVADFITFADGFLSVDSDGQGPAGFVEAAYLPSLPEHLTILLDGGIEIVVAEA